MINETQNTKNCYNCKYFSMHYSKQGSAFRSVHCGHCMNDNVKTYKIFPKEPCAHWESDISVKEERKLTVKENINFIANRLDELYNLLKED